MDLKVHFQFRSGTIDVNLNSVDLKALLQSGGISRMMAQLSEFVAQMTVSTVKEPVGEVKKVED